MNFRTFVTPALLLTFATALSQNGWKKPESIVASFTETSRDATRQISIFQSGNDIAVQSTIGINGALEGINRVEALSSKGIYTWIAGKPDHVIMLTTPTFPEFYGFLVSPRFSRADLEFNLKGIEKALNKPVQAGRREIIAGRECLVIIVLDRPDSGGLDYQKLWIDTQTGIALKVQDYFGGKLTYERIAIDVKYNSIPEDFLFAPKQDALIIKGPVSADTLLRLPNGRPHNELFADMAKINASPNAAGQMWARVPKITDPFKYAQTTYREHARHTLSGRITPSSQPTQGRGNQIGSQWSQQIFMGDANDSGDVVQITLSEARGTVALTAIPLPQTGSGSATSDQGISPGHANQNPQDPSQDKTTTALVAKSDFVLPASGDTLVFIQVKGAPAEPFLGEFALGRPKVLNVPQLSQAKSYSVTRPFKLTIVVWQRGEIRCALAATNLDESQLIEIAKTTLQ